MKPGRLHPFILACHQYTLIVERLYDEAVAVNGYGYTLVNCPPTTLMDMIRTIERSEREHAGYPVWGGGSEQTVFGSAHANYAFRYLHDHRHVEHLLDTSEGDELALARYWQRELKREGASEDVLHLAWIDTAGQARYFAEKGQFPHDQFTFALHNWR